MQDVPAVAPPLTLFQRDDCHLCDLALEVLAQARAPEFESVTAAMRWRRATANACRFCVTRRAVSNWTGRST